MKKNRRKKEKDRTSAYFFLVFHEGRELWKAMEMVAEAHPATVKKWAALGRKSWRQGELALLAFIAEIEMT